MCQTKQSRHGQKTHYHILTGAVRLPISLKLYSQKQEFTIPFPQRDIHVISVPVGKEADGELE
jgi:hypothetical protein